MAVYTNITLDELGLEKTVQPIEFPKSNNSRLFCDSCKFVCSSQYIGSKSKISGEADKKSTVKFSLPEHPVIVKLYVPY